MRGACDVALCAQPHVEFERAAPLLRDLDADDVVGGVNRGWTVGKRLLQYERSTHAGINTSGSQGGRNMASPIPELVKRYHSDEYERIGDPVLRRRVIDHQLAFKAQQLTQQRVIQETQASAPGFASSAVKLSNALITQEGDEILVAAMGTQGTGWSGKGFATDELSRTRDWLKQKSLTIAGGTKEVQMNIIAKRVLGLPDE